MIGDLRREIAAALLVVAVVAVGGFFEIARPEVVVEPHEVPGPRFAEQARFCPPSLRAGSFEGAIAASAATGGELTVGIEPALPEPVELGAERMLLQSLEKHAPATVVGYGGSLATSSLASYTGDAQGSIAALCAPSAAQTWYFPAGSTTLNFDERILIYNPFPDEAVVDVSLLTPDGEITRANLSDIGVSSGGWTSLALNEFIVSRSVLGAAVTAVRGRVVAWRTVIAQPRESAHGIYSSLGATEAAPVWYFPEGTVSPSAEEHISVLNPQDEEAQVSVSLISNGGIVQPKGLSEVTLPPRSTITLHLNRELDEKKQGSLSALLQSTNGIEVVAERTTFYATDDVRGVSSEIGASQGSKLWALGPAALSPSTDVVYVVNGGPEKVTLSLTLLQTGEPPLTPKELTDIEVPGGLRLKIPIGDITQGRAMVALLRADGLVYVERSAYTETTNDVASVMGIPLAE